MSAIQNHIIDVEIKRAFDVDPDLSWLDQTDDQMGDGWESHANERKSTYGDSWSMIGIYAQAEVVISGVCQTIRSGGLWGIEDDSDDSYLESIEREELDALSGILSDMGFEEEEVQRFAA